MGRFIGILILVAGMIILGDSLGLYEIDLVKDDSEEEAAVERVERSHASHSDSVISHDFRQEMPEEPVSDSVGSVMHEYTLFEFRHRTYAESLVGRIRKRDPTIPVRVHQGNKGYLIVLRCDRGQDPTSYFSKIEDITGFALLSNSGGQDTNTSKSQK